MSLENNIVNNTMNMEDNKEVKNNTEKEAHPCINCGKPCFGSQCKVCHLKMIEDRQGDCADCGDRFLQVRKDGSRRKRCQNCQEDYNSKYISICKKCSKTYHSVLADGRVFDSCFDCYKSSFHKCKNCDNRIKDKFTICGECFRKEKENKNDNNYPLVDCKTKGCPNKTTYSQCKECYEGIRYSENQYMVSTCHEPGCGYRSKGNFKFCNYHRTKA